MIKNYYDQLIDWYLAQCNGDWEHEYGIKIESLDNPGWSLKIDLNGTPLNGKSHKAVLHNVTEEDELGGLWGDKDWFVSRVEHDVYISYGGPRNIEDLIKAFINWSRE
jgi:hypothetical protein